jgi:dihydroorotase
VSGAPAAAAGVGATSEIGEVVADLEISRAWLVDPVSGREGPGELVVNDGVIEAVNWLDGSDAAGVDDRGIVVAPGFVDLHAHLREPGDEDAETIASGLAAAAHGGFTTVCLMANTTPPLDEPSVLARVRAAAAASGSPVEALAYGTVSAGRAGETLAALGELADAGVVGYSDDSAPVRSATILRNALAYAGMLGLPVIDHAEDPTQTAGAVANEGLPATVLGLHGWPASAEASAVARDLAILEDVRRDVAGARLHVTGVSTASALDLVRRAKAAGLPVTCDVTPHHLGLTDGWLAGWRRWAWEDDWAPGAAVDAAPYDTSLRASPPLRSAADAAACRAALVDGTADAVATDHGPRTSVEKEIEFGLAADGISGLETALGVLLAAVDAGELTLGCAIAALTVGPLRVLGGRLPRAPRGLVEGASADLVVFDRAEAWTVDPAALASKGRNTPLRGRSLPGRVLLTVAAGRLAYSAE